MSNTALRLDQIWDFLNYFPTLKVSFDLVKDAQIAKYYIFEPSLGIIQH